MPSYQAATTTHLAGARCSLAPLSQTFARKSVFPSTWRRASLAIYPLVGVSKRPERRFAGFNITFRSRGNAFRPGVLAAAGLGLLQVVGLVRPLV